MRHLNLDLRREDFVLLEDGKPLRHAAAVNEGMRLDIEFSDGNVRARAEASIVTPADKPQSVLRKPRTRRGGGDPGQGSLFGA